MTPETLEQVHSAAAYLGWVRSLISDLQAEPDGIRQIRFRTGLAKELLEEARPIGLFASQFFESSEEVHIGLKIGNQVYDATVSDARATPSGIRFLEVTLASEGELDHLRMRKLHEDGQVSGFGRITKTGTKRTGLRIEDEPEAISQESLLRLEKRLISEAIERKLAKQYPEGTALVIAFDDIMSYDRPENQANIDAAVREHWSELQRFHTIAVVGLVKELFLCWRCGAA